MAEHGWNGLKADEGKVGEVVRKRTIRLLRLLKGLPPPPALPHEGEGRRGRLVVGTWCDGMRTLRDLG